jgi:hypothetical protein
MMPISVSAMFTQLPCLGVWWNSIRSNSRRASAGRNASYRLAPSCVFRLSCTSRIFATPG